VNAVPEAKAVVAEYFAALQSGALDDALSLHHPDFYAETAPEEWREMLAQVQQRLGDLEEFTLVKRKAFFGIKASGMGTYVTLRYALRYANASTVETLVLFKASEGERPSIVSHRIDSATFADEDEAADAVDRGVGAGVDGGAQLGR
jgi:hypothetical protein